MLGFHGEVLALAQHGCKPREHVRTQSGIRCHNPLPVFAYTLPHDRGHLEISRRSRIPCDWKRIVVVWEQRGLNRK